ncbi:cytochrome c [Azospirillum fermentarium]|uniref:c-type cytochrome n=1 Tax=Azospirillum fermentarium TaxID=1233114 RepID=UPI002225F0FF|nr:cytochrome c family protein [Azospirillum fermentarium]MCW2247130.1 cytochrome c [Azospirillum fermentarium]
MSKKLLMGATIVAGLALTAMGAQAGDAAAGKEVFKVCAACHTVEQGKNKVGPSLFGVVGRTAGTIDGFKYSKPMMEKQAAGYAWTEDNLKAYIINPKAVVPGGTMAFAGLKDEAKVADLIAFLASNK